MFKEPIESVERTVNRRKHLNTIALEFKDEVLKNKYNLEALRKEAQDKEHELMIKRLKIDIKEINSLNLLINHRMELIKDRMKAHNYKNKDLLDLLNKIIKNKKVNINFENDIINLVK